MNMYAIIEKKRDGKSLTEEEINYFIKHVTNGDIPDYQTSALLMAIYFQGMTKKELSTFTLAMANSGDTVDFSKIEGIKVDKHSTGGVGDTTTLILAPLVASTGIPLAKMSGRGLGHTGGTLDKLESIPGFNIELTTNEFIELVNKNKVAVMGQSGNITPADKKLYSLRDVTATVNSIPLIASSVMSKKIAAGSDAIVLDVKTGAGAFMKTEEEATELAQTMVGIGNQLGRKTMAVISNMSEPLGNAVGNALEVKEAVATLKGKGPDDLTELCLVLGSQMVVAGEKAKTMEEAREMLEANIANGKAIEVFKTFITAQGGDEGIVQQPGRLPQAEITYDLKAKSSGYIEGITANEIGRAAMMLGAGRDRADATIDMAVGIVLHKKVGEFVKENESLLTIHANQKDLEEVKELLYRNIKLTNQPVTKHPLILGTID